MAGKNRNSAVLLMHCPDNKGIVANITAFINDNNGNIVSLDEHVDRLEKIFYMRVEWELDGFLIQQDKIADIFGSSIAERYKMNWNIFFSSKRPRMAIFVSKLSHCLYDILPRVYTGEWSVDIPLIISNHPDLEPIAKQFNIPFYYIEKNNENKIQQERKELDLLRQHDVSFIVLARYMQILSSDFISQYPEGIINIHHSFLPAFPGSKPYHSAYERGVKIIGATSHYVTTELDAGPIIDQDIIRVSHRDTIDKLIIKGRDVEKLVLSRAILMHIQHRTLLYNNRTVVFY
jgi:formyltetrahydrofolate deformylase